MFPVTSIQYIKLEQNKNIQALSVILPPRSGRKGYHNYQLVTLTCEELKFPALVYISKKAKGKCIILQNGCIPSEITVPNQFTVSLGFPWLFAKSVTISPLSTVKVVNDSINLPSENDSTLHLSDFKNISQFEKYVQTELINSSVCFKIGMKLNVQYLSKNYIFIIADVVQCYYEMPDSDKYTIGFKCHCGTIIEVADKLSASPSALTKSYRSVNREHFGGYETQVVELLSHIDYLLHNGSAKTSGILISGPPGCGKTMLGDMLSSRYNKSCLMHGAEDIISPYIGESEVILKNSFRNLKSRAPAFLFIDDIDEIFCARDQGGNTGIVNAFLHLLDGIMEDTSKDTLVICTVTQPQVIDPALRRPGRLSEDIVLSVPTESERLCILKKIFYRYNNHTFLESDLSVIASKTYGFTGGDLMRLITETFSHSDSPSLGQFLEALKTVKPSALRNVSTQACEITWEDIIGYQEMKSGLLDAFKLTLSFRNLFTEVGITSPSRFLLFGPPGCGKSMMVHALSNELSLSIIPVKRSNVLGKYFGESEKNLAVLFDLAQKSSPCILHFENFEGLAGRRQKDAATTSDVEGRIINHLKVLLDGVVEYENIFIVAETNRPDLLDKDVIRHGRFHQFLYFDLPSEGEREAVIEKTLAEVCINPEITAEVVKLTTGFTMAETKLLCKEICRKTDSSGKLEAIDAVFLKILEEVLDKVSKNTSEKMIRKYKEFCSTYCRIWK